MTRLRHALEALGAEEGVIRLDDENADALHRHAARARSTPPSRLFSDRLTRV